MESPARVTMFHLAKWMGKSIREVEHWDCQEITEWIIYYKHHPPFDPWWAYANIMCLLWNVNKGKGATKKVEDFMPRTEPKRQTEEDMKRQMFASGMIQTQES